jgi:chorismate mutase
MIKKTIFVMSIAFCFFAGKTQAQDAAPKDTMTYYRRQIDTLDKQLINLLGERMEAARIIGTYKMDHHIGVVQSARFEKVLSAAIRQGKTRYLSEEFVRALYNDIHKESIRQEEQLKAERKQAKKK